MFSLLMLLGCAQSTVTTIGLCEVELIGLEPAEAAPGDQVVLTARPLTTDYDTALYLSGVRAAISAVDRDCDECDACREAEECGDCGDCDVCDAECRSDCVETVTFVVPALPPGDATLQLFNTYGGSDALTLSISDPSDTGGGGDTASTSDTASSR